jgi:hypothetical protein
MRRMQAQSREVATRRLLRLAGENPVDIDTLGNTLGMTQREALAIAERLIVDQQLIHRPTSRRGHIVWTVTTPHRLAELERASDAAD